MRRGIRLARIAAFAVFLAFPLASLPLLSALPPYGRPFTAFPTLASVVNSPTGRAQLSDALFDRSAVRREAIAAKNAAFYYGLGYIDTPDVVSGRGEWLFYKQQFWGGRCLPAAYFRQRLAFADTLQDVAAAAGLRLVLSVSPDKATIYPEELRGVARAYWSCKAENAAAWRGIARQTAPRLVDHAEPILAAKRRTPAEPLYFFSDTHWTPFAAALARRQLAAALTGESAAALPPPRLTTARLNRRTDLGTMLLLGETESVPAVDPAIEAEVAALTAGSGPAAGATTVLHDSFYQIYRRDFQALLPAARFVHVDDDPAHYRAAIGGSQTVIVNSVERSLFDRLDGVLSWQGAVGEAILARAEERAAGCEDYAPASLLAPAPAPAPAEPPGAWAMTGDARWVTVSLPAAGAGSLPCLGVAADPRQPAVIELYLPARNGPAGEAAFEPGRSIQILVAPGARQIHLVLPAQVAGRDIRVAGMVRAGPIGLQIGILPAAGQR
jgi:hypothetical protein